MQRRTIQYTLEQLEDRVLLASVPAGFTDTTIATGLISPTAMDIAPDGRIFVAQQAGVIRVVENGSLLPTPFFTLPNVNSDVERGFLGIVLDPSFETNHFVYVYYTSTEGTIHNRIARLTANGDVAAANSLTDLVDLPPLNGAIWHMGGSMHFGVDGKLYVGVGDHQYFDQNALQTLTVPFGKILRFNSDGSIPTDNPFYNQTTGINRAIYAMGFRNPFTFGIQPGTGLTFIDDVGEVTWEEIDQLRPGGNYGWPNSEGPDNVAGYDAPIYYYNHNTGSYAITAGTFYDPAIVQFPSSYAGKYFFADLTGGWIKTLDHANGNAVATFATGLSATVDLDVGPDGTLYYLERTGNVNNGTIGRISFGTVTNTAPQIVSPPADQNISIGASVTFNVEASGSDLTFQWLKDDQEIDGATGTSYTIDNVALSDEADYRVRVSNSAGDTLSDPATLTVINQTPPTARIVSPAPGTKFYAGETFTLDGRGNDAEDGKEGPSKFTWQVDYYADNVTRPFIAPTTGQRLLDITIPTVTPYKPANVFYRISLTITDRNGATTTVTRDILPITAKVKITANIPGVTLTLEDQPMPAPKSFIGVTGITRVLGAPQDVTVGGQDYTFDHWSDGGELQHDITTPAVDTTYVARYHLTQTITNTLTFAASNDAYVYGGDPDGNFGLEDTLLAKSNPAQQYQRDVYLKFDLADMPDTIQSASLRVFAGLNNNANQDVMLGVYAAPGAKWSQNTITYNNRPGFSGKALNYAIVNDMDAQWYDIDIGAYLMSERAKGRTVFTFVLHNVTATSAVTMINSTESGSNSPEISIIQ